jgi:glutamate carboxypeptidase
MGRNQALVQIRLLMFAGVTFLTIANTATAVAKPNNKVLAAAKACEPSARSLLQQLVQIDSGTGDVAGLAAMGRILKTELEGLGASVETVNAVAPAVGDNLVATLTGAGRGRILLIAHMDTVFARGTVTQRPYAVVGNHGIGPEAGDDKGGDVTAICALRILQQLHYRDYGRITLLLNSNEETGSLGTRDLIRTMAKESDVAINLESGVPPDGY